MKKTPNFTTYLKSKSCIVLGVGLGVRFYNNFLMKGATLMSNHKSVVRNQGYTRAAAIHIERHNERKNENYGNIDVILEQSHRNIHFKKCDGTYLGVFDGMVKNGEISTRGLKLNNEGTKPESTPNQIRFCEKLIYFVCWGWSRRNLS